MTGESAGKDLEGSGRGFEAIFRHSLETEENNRNPQSPSLFSWPRFEPKNTNKYLKRYTNLLGIKVPQQTA
jgi:hypothetical protein